ncbi:MAG: Rossmann-like and DUF2520 domain-containing protein [Saprospiraceae bacterium]
MKIVLIGSGNVATHLGKAISGQRGYPIAQVYSRKLIHARSLGLKLKSEFTDDLNHLIRNADLYLIAISDDFIENFARDLKEYLPANKLIVHTSGSVSMMVLKPYFKNFGVLYPLQTFSKEKKMIYTQIPFLVCGSSKKIESELRSFAGSISKHVHAIKDEDKSYIHLAAVFVNNFTNAFYEIGRKIAVKRKIPFDFFLPLITETSAKLQSLSPQEAQTGPARRNDQKVLNAQRAILKKLFPAWLSIYNEMTALIQNFQKK